MILLSVALLHLRGVCMYLYQHKIVLFIQNCTEYIIYKNQICLEDTFFSISSPNIAIEAYCKKKSLVRNICVI